MGTSVDTNIVELSTFIQARRKSKPEAKPRDKPMLSLLWNAEGKLQLVFEDERLDLFSRLLLLGDVRAAVYKRQKEGEAEFNQGMKQAAHEQRVEAARKAFKIVG